MYREHGWNLKNSNPEIIQCRRTCGEEVEVQMQRQKKSFILKCSLRRVLSYPCEGWAGKIPFGKKCFAEFRLKCYFKNKEDGKKDFHAVKKTDNEINPALTIITRLTSYSPFRHTFKDTHVNQELDLVLLEVTADLGRQEDARAGAQFTVLLVQFPLEHKLLEVDESHGHGRLLVAALILRQLSYLSFQAAGSCRDERKRREVELPRQIISTSLEVFSLLLIIFFLPPDLAECEPYMGEFLFEGFVHVLLEVGGFDVFNDRGLKGKKKTPVVTTRTSFPHREATRLLRHPSVGLHGHSVRLCTRRPTPESGDHTNVGQKKRQKQEMSPFTSSSKCAGMKTNVHPQQNAAPL